TRPPPGSRFTPSMSARHTTVYSRIFTFAHSALSRAFLVITFALVSIALPDQARAQGCPYDYPVDCGTYCCESGGVCYNGGCNAPAPEQTSCPYDYPVDCGTYCCESGGVCYDGGCNAPAPELTSCPYDYPV